MKKRVLMIFIALLLALTIGLIVGFRSTYSLYELGEDEAKSAYNLLNNSLDETKARKTYFDYINDASVKYGNKHYLAEMENGINDNEYGYNGETITFKSPTAKRPLPVNKVIRIIFSPFFNLNNNGVLVEYLLSKKSKVLHDSILLD